MSVTAKALFSAHFAGITDTTEYTTPVSTRTIIDKFTATNTDVATRTVTVNLIPSGGSAGSQNIVTSALSLTAGQSVDLPEQHNQILNSGDIISVVASVANKIVIRASGREIV